ncbi:hypothetical protein AC249_AIPGENE23912 [Exaiptasia diaphana]|nr:hypothetical protein AC249_AIPGENE23912 [Exaiptasia diaphana]
MITEWDTELKDLDDEFMRLVNGTAEELSEYVANLVIKYHVKVCKQWLNIAQDMRTKVYSPQQEHEIDILDLKCKDWGFHLRELFGPRLGCGDYGHLVIKHIPMLMRVFRSTKQYLNQGLEAAHSYQKTIYARSTSHDGPQGYASSLEQILVNFYTEKMLHSRLCFREALKSSEMGVFLEKDLDMFSKACYFHGLPQLASVNLQHLEDLILQVKACLRVQVERIEEETIEDTPPSSYEKSTETEASTFVDNACQTEELFYVDMITQTEPFLDSLENKILELEAKTETLSKQKEDIESKLFKIDQFSSKPSAVAFYTGFTNYETFLVIFNYIDKTLNTGHQLQLTMKILITHEIIIRSGFLGMPFQDKDLVMADKGFTVDDLLLPKEYMRFYFDYLYEERVLPSVKIRVDKGTETGVMGTMHCFLRAKHGDMEDPSDSVVFGPSTQNKIERWWRELLERMERFFKKQLSSLIENGDYDSSDEIDRLKNTNY